MAGESARGGLLMLVVVTLDVVMTLGTEEMLDEVVIVLGHDEVENDVRGVYVGVHYHMLENACRMLLPFCPDALGAMNDERTLVMRLEIHALNDVVEFESAL